MRKQKFVRKVAGSIALVAVFASAPIQHAVAVEGGAGVYLNGFSGFMAGVLPEKGTYATNYAYYYSGDAGGDLEIPFVGNVQLGAEADLFIDLVSLVHVTEFKVFGGRYAFGILGGYGDLDLEVQASAALGTISAQDDDAGLVDSAITPLILGWNSENHNLAFGFSVVIPTGRYDRNSLANVGLNRWAIEPNLAYTYFNPKNGREFSLNVIYDYNFENDETNYKSGQELHADFTLAQYFPNGLGVGIGGYLYKQITDDDGAAARLDGFKGQVIGVGPQLLYQHAISEEHVLIVQAKYQKEFAVENRLEGEAVWFNLTVNF